ncbi:MAG: TetR/AcrR family transcriptional regulator [Bacteroidia bacterium]|nr:TetR/AcrR family transcriptional regulator [Bacteroidia bacterium]
MEVNNKDKARDNIIKAAIVVFGKYGYKKATLDDIGNVVGKGKTGLYYYFKNKEDVFKAVIEKEANELALAINNAVNNSLTPSEKLKAYFFTRMNTLLKVSIFYDAMKNELLDNLQFINQTRLMYDKAELQLVKQILLDGVKQNYFDIENLEITANTIVTALKGLEIPFFVQNGNADFEKNIENLFNLICFGLVKRN